jgi:hypothetical protein
MSGSGMPAPGTQDGNWVWDGSEWVCNPDCGSGYGGGAPAPCPPFGPPVFSGPVGQPPWYPGANGGVSFGAAAPPNPVRGHMWWDGTTFWLFDGAAWVSISPSAGSPAGGTHSFVQPSAPSSAVTGDVWWNGKEFYVWDGLAWNAVGPSLPVGVTDGSNAPAGYVGEFISTSANMSFAASPAITTQTLSTLVVPAGDWDVDAYAGFSTFTGPLWFVLSPAPTGISNPMNAASIGISSSMSSQDVVLNAAPARASFTASTLLSFQLSVNQSGAGLLAGTASLFVQARRAR